MNEGKIGKSRVVVLMKNKKLLFGMFLAFYMAFSFTLPRGVKVYCIGDSTMSEYNVASMNERYGGEDFPRRGWAMALQAYLSDHVEVINNALSGRSTKSFISEGSWDSVKKEIRKGDFVVIQFGHNDEKTNDPNRYTDPNGEFRENLIRFVNDSRERGAYPVLVTPIARRNFNQEGKLIDTHGLYPDATRDVAKETGVPLIDLTVLTMNHIQKLGVEASKALFLHIEPGMYRNLPDGMADNTHLSKTGACVVAGLFVEGIKKSASSLADHILTNPGDCCSQ